MNSRWAAWLLSICATIAIAWRWSPLWGLIVPLGFVIQLVLAVRIARSRPGSSLSRFGFVVLLSAASLGMIFVAVLVWLSGAGPRYD